MVMLILCRLCGLMYNTTLIIILSSRLTNFKYNMEIFNFYNMVIVIY